MASFMTSTLSHVFRSLSAIVGYCQNYVWGKESRTSIVASFYRTQRAKSVKQEQLPDVDPDKKYAELWFGAHPAGHATLAHTGESICAQYGQIPFLLKILSIATPLSIQVHPTKEQALALHTRDPANYKDANHKPEMAVALTDVELMCGFRPFREIRGFVQTVPELQRILGPELVDQVVRATTDDEEKVALKQAFRTLLLHPKDNCAKEVSVLCNRLVNERRTDITSLFILKLSKEFPTDHGVFCPYFLNCLKLHPGDCVFMEPPTVHGYVHGDLLECMAPSDNVVRAGLTQKHRDVATLCAMLKYDMAPPEMLTPVVEARGGITVHRYVPPTDEFCVTMIEYSAESNGAVCQCAVQPECRCTVRPFEAHDRHGERRFEAGVVMEGEVLLQSVADPATHRVFSEGEAFCLNDGVNYKIIFTSVKAKVFIASENVF